MEKHRNATKVGRDMHKVASPTPSSHGGELCDTAQDLMEEVATQMGTTLKMPFRFTQLSRLPSESSPSFEHRCASSTTPNNWMHYCVHVRVTLQEGKGDQPPPSHAWSGLLIADILQEACPGD